MEKNINKVYWQKHKINKTDRGKILGQESFLIWFTGLPSSGKSTIANSLECRLYKLGYLTYILDGDNIRRGLNSDLGFSVRDRTENIRRIGHVTNLLIDAGIIVIAAFISPFEKDRRFVKELLGNKNMIEVFVNCPLEVCVKRDVKGLYKKAIDRKISGFTGISSLYEKPKNPDITIDSDRTDIEGSTKLILKYLDKYGFIFLKRGANGNL